MLFAGAQEGTRILEFATDYFRITIIGFVFSSLGMVINAAQRGCGNTRVSMYTNIIANLVSLLLNFLLITGRFGFPALGVRGAAIATVAGNITMFIICMINVSKPGGFLRLRLKFKLDKDILKSVANVSSSAFVEQIFMRIGFFTTARLIAGLNSAAVPALAAYTICMHLQNMSFTFGDGLSVASSSLVGRSLGAKRPDMAIVYGKVSQRLAYIISIILFFIFIFGRYFFIGLFTDTEAVTNMAVAVVILIAVSSPFQMSQVVLAGSLRGAGDTKFIAAVSFICIVFIRPGLTWAFCYPLGFGLTGAWIALTIDQIIRMLIVSRRFAQGKWTEKKV
jgi:putative MATE family efflux protein